MRLRLDLNAILLSFLLAVIFLTGGCSEGKPPAAISLEQIPVEFGKAFASAKGETKELSDMVVATVQSKELSKASMALEALLRRTDLSKVQSRTAAGAAMTVNAALVEAASKGDARAAETLNVRRNTK